MLEPEFVTATETPQSATIRFHVLPWEGNRVGILHGGAIASMLDQICGLTSSAYMGHWGPTLSLNIDFVRPANVGDVLLATATILSTGKRIIRLRAELTDEKSGKLVAACSASFFNKENN